MKNSQKLMLIMLFITMIMISFTSCISTQKKYPGFATNDIVKVDISLVSESVILESWDGDTINVQLISHNAKKYLPVISYDNKVMSVVQKNWSLPLNYSCSVKVQYPKSFNANLVNPDWNISTVSGSISGEGVTGSVIKAESVSGRISLTEVKSTDLIFVKTVSGQISLTGSTVKLDAKSTSGSIRMVGTALEVYASSISGSIYTKLDKPIVFDSKYNTVSGSINIVMNEHPGFVLNYSTKSGGVHNEFTSANLKGFGIDIYKKGSVVIEAATKSGSIWLEKN